MGWDTNFIHEKYDEMVEAKKDQIHILAYKIAKEIIRVYEESDDDAMFSVEEEVEHAYEIIRKMER